MTALRIAVTGSTGFIGHHACLQFARLGWNVRAVLRPETLKPIPAESEAVTSRLVQSELTQAFTDCDVVLHLAGRTRAPSLEEFLVANARVTQQVSLAARDANARLIHVSSQAAAGTGTKEKPRIETALPSPVSDYGRSKLAGEEAVRGVEGLRYTILRPCAIYGPVDRDFSLLFFCAQRGLFPLLGHSDAAFCFLYIEDLIQAIERVIRHPEVDREVFFVGPEVAHTAEELMRTLAAVWDKPYRPLRLPSSLLWLAAAVSAPAARLGLDPILTRSRYQEITSEGFVCSSEKLRLATGFEARVSLEEGLRRTSAWYTTHRAALETT